MFFYLTRVDIEVARDLKMLPKAFQNIMIVAPGFICNRKEPPTGEIIDLRVVFFGGQKQ